MQIDFQCFCHVINVYYSAILAAAKAVVIVAVVIVVVVNNGRSISSTKSRCQEGPHLHSISIPWPGEVQSLPQDFH